MDILEGLNSNMDPDMVITLGQLGQDASDMSSCTGNKDVALFSKAENL